LTQIRDQRADGQQVLDDTLELARRRANTARPDRANRIGAVAMGVPFLIAAATLAGFTPEMTARDWAMAALLAALYQIASRVDFEAAQGSTVPSQQILVAIYLLLPPSIAPLVAFTGLLCSKPSWVLQPYRLHALLLRATSSWLTIGPALVLYHFHDGPAQLSKWPLYVAALLAQYAIDTTVALIRVRSLGVPATTLSRLLPWTFAVDTVMAIIGFSAVLAADGSLAVVPFLVAPIGLIWLLAHDRRRQVETSLSLGKAVLEARDEARLDPLTGVANRRAWEEAVREAQTEIHASWGTRIAVVAVADVDRLKHVNDTLGHSVGDAMLAATARALLREAPVGATVARLGGDEFGVLWVATREEYDASDIVHRLRAVMTAGEAVEHLPVLASVGFATTPPADSVGAAIERADTDLFEQKQRRPPTD